MDKVYSIKTKPGYVHLLIYILLPVLFVGGIIYRLFHKGIDLDFGLFLIFYSVCLVIYTFVFYRRITIFSDGKVIINYLVRKPLRMQNISEIRINNPWDRFGLFNIFTIKFDNGKSILFSSRFHTPADSIIRFFYKFYREKTRKS